MTPAAEIAARLLLPARVVPAAFPTRCACGRTKDRRSERCRACWDASPAKRAQARAAGRAASGIPRPCRWSPVEHAPSGRRFASVGDAAAAEGVTPACICRRLHRPASGWRRIRP